MEAGVTIRLIVTDVAAATAFYTGALGFSKETETPAFGAVAKGGLKLFLSGPKSAAGKPLPDGTVQSPGGWNRVMLAVTDIAAEMARLTAAGVRFRSEPVTGPAGTFAILDDPSGNPIELWQAATHH
ncbi:MAG: VOC family protein [Bauldia sp.]|nr:VOC family protein [Bauldia sp.]